MQHTQQKLLKVQQELEEINLADQLTNFKAIQRTNLSENVQDNKDCKKAAYEFPSIAATMQFSGQGVVQDLCESTHTERALQANKDQI